MRLLGQAKCRQIISGAYYAELGPNGSLQYVRSRQNLRLCRYMWPVERPRGIVFCIHGFGDHTGNFLLRKTRPGRRGKYSRSIVSMFNSHGYSVACMDLQGCGRSDGHRNRRGYFHKFSDLVKDYVEFVQDVRGQLLPGFPYNVPSFLFGANMGGCLAVHVAQQCPGNFAGVALLSPMLSVQGIQPSGINRCHANVAGLLNLLIPNVLLVPVGRYNRFPETQEFWDCDPATFKGRVCARVAYQCIKAISRAQVIARNVSFPYLIVHGSEDTLSDPQGSKNFHHASKSEDKTLHMAENMWHLLTAEPGCEMVLQEVLQWYNQKVDSLTSSVIIYEGTQTSLNLSE